VLTAFALPSPGRGGVLFLQPLLERLTRRETVAIFAHEVAHLEQFARRPLRLLTALGLLPIAAAAFMVPAVERFAPAGVAIAVMAWPIVVFTGVVLRHRRHQPLELAGDRRAAELCGDPEALASALIRLYALARMPRRIDVDVERWASHPSLARRVQALRALSSVAPASVREPQTFAATDRQGPLTFDVEGVRIGTLELTRYSDLHELRLQFRGESPLVVGRDRAGRTFQVPVRGEDAPAIHAVLDQVDVLLTPELPRSSAVRWGGTLAAFAALAAVLGGPVFSVFVAAGLATFRASAATLAAAATAGIAGGVLLWVGSPGMMPPPTAWILWLIGAAIGFVTLRAAPLHTDRMQRTLVHITTAVLALSAVITWTLAYVLYGASAWGLHQAAIAAPGIAVFPLTLAAALAFGPGPIRRALAAVISILGVVPAVAASDWFVTRTVNDPFITAAPRLETAVASLHDVRSLTLTQETDGIQLSPGGRWLAAALYDESGEAEVTQFALHAVDGRTLRLGARALAFLDDEHVVVSDRARRLGSEPVSSPAASDPGTSTELSVRQLAPGLPVLWRESIPQAGLWQLDVSPRNRTWRLLGWGDGGEAVRFEGRVGTSQWTEQRWPVPSGGDISGNWHVGSNRYAVRLEGFEMPSWRTTLTLTLGMSSFTGYRRAYIVDAAGGARLIPTELKVDCVPPAIGREAITCLAFDGRRTRVFRVAEEVTPVALVPGALWVSGEHEDGTLVGAVSGRSLLVQPDTHRLVTFDGSGDYWFDVGYAGRYVALSTFGNGNHASVQVARLRIR
jgi:Zn-dependent protease with chaperone function